MTAPTMLLHEFCNALVSRGEFSHEKMHQDAPQPKQSGTVSSVDGAKLDKADASFWQMEQA